MFIMVIYRLHLIKKIKESDKYLRKYGAYITSYGLYKSIVKTRIGFIGGIILIIACFSAYFGYFNIVLLGIPPLVFDTLSIVLILSSLFNMNIWPWSRAVIKIYDSGYSPNVEAANGYKLVKFWRGTHPPVITKHRIIYTADAPKGYTSKLTIRKWELGSKNFKLLYEFNYDVSLRGVFRPTLQHYEEYEIENNINTVRQPLPKLQPVDEGIIKLLGKTSKDVITYLGKNYETHDGKNFINNKYISQRHISYKQDGISILLWDDSVKTIFFYRQGVNNFDNYSRWIVDGLSVGMNRLEIKSKFGRAHSLESGPDAKYFKILPDCSVTIVYNDKLELVKTRDAIADEVSIGKEKNRQIPLK